MSESTMPGTIIAPNHLELELGKLTDEQMKRVVEVLRTFMERLRVIEARADASLPKRCATCALNPATDHWPGFAPTAYGVLWSVREMKHFRCHEGDHTNRRDNIFTTKNLTYCKGFHTVVMTQPLAAEQAMLEAFAEIVKIVPTHRTGM